MRVTENLDRNGFALVKFEWEEKASLSHMSNSRCSWQYSEKS